VLLLLATYRLLFEAAARHQNFTRAAHELCVTQGAVSHQVKALEAELGLKLFNRERQGLAITDAGHDYLAVVRDAFDRIALGTDRLLQRLHSGVITVSMSPDFAAKWLVSRLGRFAEAYPKIELKVSATMHHVDFAREDVDLAIRHGSGNWVGLDAVNLGAEELFPVCKSGSPRQPARNPPSLVSGPAGKTSVVRVLHARRGSVPEEIPLADFMTRCEGYFASDGCLVDQPFQPRLPDGMIRCYMGADKVVGFGHQFIKALIPPPPEGPDPQPQPGPRIMHGADAEPFQVLRAKMEAEWTPQMMEILGIG
jgi:hypothetical protein